MTRKTERLIAIALFAGLLIGFIIGRYGTACATLAEAEKDDAASFSRLFDREV